ncbi:MAG TPA: hypothetical protein VKZ94_08095 [Advenella sp.]|nr:hypothetical protein [Advenella sp.]
MSIETCSRCAIVLSLVVFIAGCGTADNKKPVAADLSNDCKWHRSSCLYEGSYEPGERDYAEQEAKRLNLAQTIRLTHSTWQ